MEYIGISDVQVPDEFPFQRVSRRNKSQWNPYAIAVVKCSFEMPTAIKLKYKRLAGILVLQFDLAAGLQRPRIEFKVYTRLVTLGARGSITPSYNICGLWIWIMRKYWTLAAARDGLPAKWPNLGK